MSVAPPPRRVDKRWELREPDPGAVAALAGALGLEPLIATLLVNRGIDDPDEAERFLSPRLSHMDDPFLMKGMEAAVDRVLRAIEGGERICVWGDYDVDGVTSASQLLAFFRAIGVDVDFFVPDRFVDGYGVSAARIPELAGRGVDLLVTVDCGVSNAAEVEVAREHGMDVVVVDHHQVPPDLPRAAALLDPHQEGCTYPFKGLAACGVTFVLMVALRARLRERGWFTDRTQPDLRRWLDLTAIGTVADMVPLVGLNRVIVHHGLRQIARTERPGVRALCRVSGLEQDRINAGRIGFHLGPRINAAGRVAHASAGVELLTSTDEAAALDVAQRVDEHNHQRRGLQKAIFEEACRRADAHPEPDARRAIVLAAEGWHPGVLGIVASKMVERYHRPTVMMTIEEGVAKGSARSISGFRLVEHLRTLDHLLDKYGGHDHAAGLSLVADRLEDFTARFEERARTALEAKHLRPRLGIDAESPLERLSWKLVEDLQRLAPYGMGNPEPNLLARGVPVLQRRVVGKDRTHLKLTLDGGGVAVDAIAFGMADLAPEPGARVDVVYVPEINEFRGRSTLQARVKALRPAS
ncbi:MAG: single-stranded-DNA-specific exonuclease RecJ [Myxococcota bacterium]